MRLALIVPGGVMRRVRKKKKTKPSVVIPGGVMKKPSRKRAHKPPKARKIVHPRPRTVAALA